MPDPLTAHELYIGGPGYSIQHVSSVTHRATMKQVLSQEDKSRFRSKTEAAKREKNSRRIELLDGPSIPSPRKAATPIRPVLSPSSHRASPRPSTTSSTLRERLIHLLAIQPLPLSQLTTLLRTHDEDLVPVLKKVATSSKGNWRLRPVVYPDIRIWEWRYDEKERKTVLKNAHDAYAALKLPPNAPERANLQPKKPQHLVPPPPQRRPSADASSPRKRPAVEDPPAKKKKKTKTKAKAPPAAPPPPLPTPSVPAVPAVPATLPPQSSSSESDDEFAEPFAVDPITNQAQFLAACKRHDEAQAEYAQLKGRIKEHRQYVEALAQVDADRIEDENEVRSTFYRKLRSFYLSHGGTATQWRTVVRLCRQFNWTLAKVNTLWDEIERAYAEHHFTLPANAKNN
ncbi:hypothetical protein BJV82DRAFT_114744 [Fennellomyces sp. T-0311]|nr:hypothetical protein BJV82DRAFT_114744 [Fennellomyces sp. T-0311]